MAMLSTPLPQPRKIHASCRTPSPHLPKTSALLELRLRLHVVSGHVVN